jgi:hypothetical protein
MSNEEWDPNRVYECSGEPTESRKIHKAPAQEVVPDPKLLEEQVKALLGEPREP